MKVFFHTLGCKVNQYETQEMREQLTKNGYEITEDESTANIFVINSCTVTSESDRKTRQCVRHYKKKYPDSTVVLTGCMPQSFPEMAEKLVEADIVLGNKNNKLLVSSLNEYLSNSCRTLHMEQHQSGEALASSGISKFEERTRAILKIEDGCDNYCSYCTIPYARGHVRSRKKEDVISEIQALTDSGIKEIVLAGINTGHYGKDLSDYDFSDLLDEICLKVNNLGKLRISSIEMTEITDKLLNVLKKHEKHFCNHLHIPLQGGCDNTLKRMHRKYNTDEYYNKINLIRSYFNDINITTDVMTGFSGETIDDFNDSLNFIESIGYGEMHVFPYSRRPRTVAYHYDDIVDPIEKKRRVSLLLELNKKQAIKYRSLFLNKELEVLIEKEKNGYLYGHTSNYLEVVFKNKNNIKVNEYCKVLITDVDYPICKGEMI